MVDHRRIRIAPDLETRIHRFALREGRTFDGAAKRLLTLGLDTASAPASGASRQTPDCHAADRGV